MHKVNIPSKLILCLGILFMSSHATANEDPYLWLEDIDGEKPLAWVESQNEKATSVYGTGERFKALQARIKEVLDTDDRIPYVSKLGAFYYNFWQDENNPKGILRRTTLEEYVKDTPSWETVLDVDLLANEEEENWVYKGSVTLRPTFDRTLISLSRGGGDATVIREFDLEKLTWVTDGFTLEEAKSNVDWVNKDTILVASEFGEGSLTQSGYPRIVKKWTRGTPLDSAAVMIEGNVEDVVTFGFSYQIQGFERHGVEIVTDFYNTEMHLMRQDGLVHVPKPSHASAWFFRDFLLIEPKETWQVNDESYEAGSLLAVNVEEFLSGDFHLDVLFQPTPSRSLAGTTATKNYLVLNVLDNVKNQVIALEFSEKGWEQSNLSDPKGFQTVSVSAVDADVSNQLFVRTSDFLTPPTLLSMEIGKEEKLLKQEPEVFDSTGLTVSQHWATSKDGTSIPYFQVGSNSDGPKPTSLYGYGGFEISMVPFYSKITGLAWLEEGGVYVVANIRGGGEFGPSWHRAALKENRHLAYEDFIAIAEDLIERGVTSSELLSISGGSNGGLLMGNMLTQRPDLFGAIVASVPLFDMKRYHLLLAGASWVAEYGDPDIPEEWVFLQKYSPYHNLDVDQDYPMLLVTSSTRDDRVHPGHGRKLVAKMQDLAKHAVYYENTEGGHAGAADNSQRAFMNALEFSFLWQTLTQD